MMLSLAKTLDLSAEECDLIVHECEIQHDTSPESLQGMSEGYANAKLAALGWSVATSRFTPDNVEAFVLDVAAIVKPQNGKGYRTTPVTFANGSEGLVAQNIPRVMRNWAEAFAELRFLDATEAYTEFERIHPFEDGNGRVGWLVWCIYTMMTKDAWPLSLPPDVFGSDS